jgi:hypothetical protein
MFSVRLSARVVVVAVFLAGAVHLSGCSECRTDQDCAVRLNAPDLLCVEGRCSVGDPTPEAAPGCSADAACGDNERCIAGGCVAAPPCLQLEATFVARIAGQPPGTVTATTSGCAVSLRVDVGTVATTVAATRIAPTGAWAGATNFDGSRGGFDPVQRTGELFDVGGTGGPAVRFGTSTFPCSSSNDCTAQVGTACVFACGERGVGGCATEGACPADGFCPARDRGVCR